MEAFKIAIIFVFTVCVVRSQVVLNPIFHNGMVLEKAPKSPAIFGTAEPGEAIFAEIIKPDTDANPDISSMVADEEGNFFLQLPPQEPGSGYTLKLNNVTTIEDLAFGDVWVCSGQSNMQKELSSIFNAENEINRIITENKELRYMYVNFVDTFSYEPKEFFQAKDILYTWTRPEYQSLSVFPALCALYGAELQNQLGYPIGLIASTLGGTFIENWSRPNGLQKCAVPPSNFQDPTMEIWNDHVLYNGMVHPITKYSISGVIWYQGENNAGYPEKYSSYRMDKYWCTFREMVNDWRQTWHENTNGDSAIDFPFGFVQLAGYLPQTENSNWPLLRWHQTHDLGFVPNENLPNVFMTVSIDTDDSELDPLHPRDKLTPAKRLAFAAMELHYKRNNDFTMPHIVRACWENDEERTTVRVQTSAKILYEVNNPATSGFAIMCDSADLNDAAGRNTWIDVPASQSKDDYFIEVDLGSNPEIAECVQTEAAYPFLISYLWKEAPCPDALDCPAYATDCVDLTGNEDCLELPVSMPLAPWGGYVRPSAECSP